MTSRQNARIRFVVATVAAASFSCARVPVSRCPDTSASEATPAQHVWSTVLGDGNGQEASAIDVDRAGNAYVVGSYENTFVAANRKVIRSSTRWGVFVQKLDPDGRLVWERHFGGDRITRGQAVKVDSSGNVLVAGSTLASSIDFGGGALRNADLDRQRRVRGRA